MRIVAVSRLHAGMRLARPVYSCAAGNRLALLERHATITEGVRTGLMRAGVYAVYVEDEVSEGIEPADPLSPELRDRAIGEIHRTFAALSTKGAATRIPGEQVERLGDVVRSVMANLRSSRGLVSSLVDLQTFDSYTLSHSLNVCVLGLMIGDEALRHGWRDARGVLKRGELEDRLEKLGLGLLLHDVGKLVIPASILQKPGRLTEDEMAIVRQHPEAGLDLVERDTVSPLARAAILGHHERIDGAGYPFGKRGDEIHQNARIAAVADVYDAVSSMRVYQARRPTHEAWELVMSLAGTALSMDLVKIFKRTVAPYPEGVAVMLSDGRRGVVSRVSRDYVTRPRVRVTHAPGGRAVTPHEIELYEERDVTIVDTLADLLAEPRPEGPPPAPGRTHAETHEQRLAQVIAAV